MGNPKLEGGIRLVPRHNELNVEGGGGTSIWFDRELRSNDHLPGNEWTAANSRWISTPLDRRCGGTSGTWGRREIRQGEEATAGKAGDGLATPTPSARCTPPPQQRTAPLLYNKMKKERLLPVGVASGYSRPTSGNALFDGPDMRPIQMVILCRTIYVGPPIPFSSLPNCRDRPAEPSRGRGGGRDRCKVWTGQRHLMLPAFLAIGFQSLPNQN